MTTALVYTGVLVQRRCWCGIHYAIPAELAQTADHNRRQVLFCPLGHEGVSAVHQEREVDRLRREVANQDEDLRVERASHSATRGQLTKARKRAAKGVCPCCNRSFVNVARHVAGQHPKFTP